MTEADKTINTKDNEQPPLSKSQDGEADQKPEHSQPAGGFDDTPIPHAPLGYTIQITFHRATNLPMADVSSLSSDPYIIAQVDTALPARHKEDPPLRKRTETIRRSVDPEWNTDWTVANVPGSGFRLKARIYDEDLATNDDRLGNAHYTVGHIDEQWPGLDDQWLRIQKRSGSKRAYLARIFSNCIGTTTKHMDGRLYVSIKMLGRTEDRHGGRVYTLGPNWFTKHYSPMLGRFVGTKDGDRENDQSENAQEKKKAQSYNFQANQMQLTGPVPEQLYHRFVEFKPWVKAMFTVTGIRGFLLAKTLHSQHARVYSYDRNTRYGTLPSHTIDVTKQFLDLVHYDHGGRIFTYVLTLDGVWRFTETGKEFGIDMLSKHTMHADVSIYIAFSGEFFIRRLKDKGADLQAIKDGDEPTHPPVDVGGGDDPDKDPAMYSLVIDNDSGTYRPKADMLPHLKRFLELNLPGLKIVTLDCQGDADRMKKMKQEQRKSKQAEGDHIVYTQRRSSSISSSDEEALDDVENEGRKDRNVLRSVKRDQSGKQKARKARFKELAKGRDVDDEEPDGPSQKRAGPRTERGLGTGTEPAHVKRAGEEQIKAMEQKEEEDKSKEQPERSTAG